MTYTILIPILVTVLSCSGAYRNARSSGLGGLAELMIYGSAALILSLATWLGWALFMWGLA